MRLLQSAKALRPTEIYINLTHQGKFPEESSAFSLADMINHIVKISNKLQNVSTPHLLKPLQKPSYSPFLVKYSGPFLGPNIGDDFVALDTVEVAFFNQRVPCSGPDT